MAAAHEPGYIAEHLPGLKRIRKLFRTATVTSYDKLTGQAAGLEFADNRAARAYTSIIGEPQILADKIKTVYNGNPAPAEKIKELEEAAKRAQVIVNKLDSRTKTLLQDLDTAFEKGKKELLSLSGDGPKEGLKVLQKEYDEAKAALTGIQSHLDTTGKAVEIAANGKIPPVPGKAKAPSAPSAADSGSISKTLYDANKKAVMENIKAGSPVTKEAYEKLGFVGRWVTAPIKANFAKPGWAMKGGRVAVSLLGLYPVAVGLKKIGQWTGVVSPDVDPNTKEQIQPNVGDGLAGFGLTTTGAAVILGALAVGGKGAALKGFAK